MKRILIFTLVAPPLSFATAFWILLQLANWAEGSPFTFNLRQVALLPTVYLIGLIPALLAATYDFVMEEANVSYRAGLTAMFAYAVSYGPLVIAGAMEFTQGPVFWLFGLVGAVPAALCSWLATEQPQQPHLQTASA
ncbi:MAG: DUF5413 family protein [Bradyrhizobium sp.]|uniref:DUF5413 family protein n=1 Tax=Bradyrhizobium sp. TaxID=376 RepID=UPI0027231A6C|nr:DUF5413 family protein [Bradyrhizobium sp.]MDO8400376.1 DUF5413 family protein [Bradyrhizobium sp.]